MDIEEFGHALFIDHEIQVAEKFKKIAQIFLSLAII